MSKKIKNIILCFLLIFSLIASVQQVRAQDLDDGSLGKDIKDFTEIVGKPYSPEKVGFKEGQKNMIDIYKLLIGRFAAFLSIVFFVQVIIGGVQLMMAGGSEEKVGEAKKRIMHGVIGIGIVLSAYIITYFVLTQVSRAAGVKTGFE
ncbi:MAG: hypothetical protein V1860_00825 [bacterium]